MKVVIFCGGLGMRMRSEGAVVPKPMMKIGNRPILWHIMRYYAHLGHTEFILCLGYGANVIKDYFLHYSETESNDFVLHPGGEVELLESDITDWRITFAYTGSGSSIGERLRRVRRFLGDDETFFANYGDCLSDVDMNVLVDRLPADHVGSLLAVAPQDSFHVVKSSPDGRLTALQPVADMDMRINGGFFILRQGIFEYIGEGEDLVMDGCVRAADEGRFSVNKYDGFWACMDTLKERAALEEMELKGNTPWALWRRPRTIRP